MRHTLFALKNVQILRHVVSLQAGGRVVEPPVVPQFSIGFIEHENVVLTHDHYVGLFGDLISM